MKTCTSEKEYMACINAVGKWCQTYIVSTSMRRQHVVLTLIGRYFTSCARWEYTGSLCASSGFADVKRSWVGKRGLLGVCSPFQGHAYFKQVSIFSFNCKVKPRTYFTTFNVCDFSRPLFSKGFITHGGIREITIVTSICKNG